MRMVVRSPSNPPPTALAPFFLVVLLPRFPLLWVMLLSPPSPNNEKL